MRRTLAVLRGWTAGAGLPDESRAGRVILRDYTNGKLVFCLLPPGGPDISWVPSGNDNGSSGKAGAAAACQTYDERSDSEVSSEIDDREGSAAAASSVGQLRSGGLPGVDDMGTWEWEELAASGSGQGMATSSGVKAHTLYSLPKFGPLVSDRPAPLSALRGGSGGGRLAAGSSGAPGGGGGAITAPGGVPLDEADLELLEEMGRAGGSKKQRPEYKFNKKAARTKGNRGQQKGEGGFDGGAMLTGKKGGLVRATGY